MLFNSFSFLIFFTILVIVYYVIPHKFRWILLVLASYYFYSTFNLGYVLLLFACTLFIYFSSLGVQISSPGKKKILLVAAAVVSLIPLVVFKYFDFLTNSLNEFFAIGQSDSSAAIPKLNLLLPVGLSFFTFSCLSYLFDVYRGKLAAETHLGRLALYISFFPKLLAGPIERATAFLPQILKPIRFDPAHVTPGLQQMLWGLFKKIVIADRLAIFVDATYQHPEFSSPVALVIATYFFAFQIYCDFSGYSDIAIGAARVLGFNLMENFRRPYLAKSVPEFWGKDRWHISLSQWFRDYMYFPMGGSRVSKPRMYFNQMAVFLVSGLWHGANWTFVVWGALNGAYQIIALSSAGASEKISKVIHLPKAVGSALSALVTFHLVLVSWVFFRAASISDAIDVFSRVFNAAPRLPTLFSAYVFSGEMILSIILIAVLIVIEVVDESRGFWDQLRTRPVYVRWAVYYAMIFGLIVLGQWGLKQFVYMQF